MSRNLVIFVILVIAVYIWQKPDVVEIQAEISPELIVNYDSGLNVDNPPIQKDLEKSEFLIRAGQYTITPLASFQAAARVLGAKHYRIDRESELAPVDLALGWGPMAKPDVLTAIDISQSGRFYHWWTDNFPIPRQEIETNSANMHFIPANTEVEKKLKQINEGDHVRFKGYLVRVEAEDGWRWISSLTRGDTGKGACELILLDDISQL